MAEDTNSKTELDENLAAEVERISDEAEKKEKNRKKGLIWGLIGIAAGLFLIGIVVTYGIEADKYDKIFFDSTYINGIDAAGKTPDEVREIIKNKSSDYEIIVKSRGRDDEIIGASQVDMHYATDEELEKILSAQKKWKFYFEKHNDKIYDVPAVLKIDENKLAAVCEKLPPFEDRTAYPSINAEIGEYNPQTNEYDIIPEVNGNRIVDKKTAIDYISESMLTLKNEVNLDDGSIDIYPTAEVNTENSKLLADKKAKDTLVKSRIVYEGSDLVLDGSTIKDWVIEDESGGFVLNENMVESYVKKIANKYDTIGTERKFKSWYGNETSVSGGPYGWKVNQEEEKAMILSLIPDSANVTREPVFEQRAASFGDVDWGDTYVEVNLAKQHLFCIKDGKLAVETDIVSGGLQRRAPTPTGVYSVAYKQHGAVLRGPRRADGSYEWESPVTYWMPFNKGIGLHDATWRGSFGGTIYKYNGSHGCVNLPKKNAQIVFESIEKGCPVIVYDDDFEIIPEETEEETVKETQKETSAPKKKTKPAPQPAPQPETQPETEPEGQADPVIIPAETQQEIGPAFTQAEPATEASQEVGPGITQADVEITTNAENLPGGM